MPKIKISAENISSGTVPVERISGITNSQISSEASIAWSKLDTRVVIRTTGSSYQAAKGDLVIVNLSSPAAFTVNTPTSPVAGDWFTVKDGAGTASLYPVTILPASGTIDGNSSVVAMSAYFLLQFTYNGTQWNITGAA